MEIETVRTTDGVVEVTKEFYPYLPRKGDIIIIYDVEYEVQFLMYDTSTKEYSLNLTNI